MDTKIARRKSFDVEYVVVSAEFIQEIATWCGGTVDAEGDNQFVKVDDKNARNLKQTQAFIGDHIVKVGSGFKCYTQKAFDKSFDDVSTEHEVTHINQDDPSAHEVARSARTGQFVTKQEAEENPDTTVVETVETPTENQSVVFSVPTENLGGL